MAETGGEETGWLTAGTVSVSLFRDRGIMVLYEFIELN